MKKLFYILSVAFICISCDPPYDDYYFIDNDCEETISVTAIVHERKRLNFSVAGKTKYMFHLETDIFSNFSGEYVFTTMEIMKKDVTSQTNFLVKEKWEFVKLDKRVAEWHLTVRPEDFE
ncbi:MAG: hypothetical protein Q4G63_12550 [Bacteroidia bacterium]|nr:hypothetical protein [Bacteroidia bacterium]